MKTKIQETKEKILDALENKSISELAEEYVEAEKKLLKELEKLSDFGEECSCDNKNIIRTIHEGEFPEITTTYCLNCGGYVNE